ncbi:MAG: PD-(D/E)XK nuclease family protein [Nitrospirota bacterium]|nr:PD-(D/E)XK nuclease family protein [Nitrospirota bacterium]
MTTGVTQGELFTVVEQGPEVVLTANRRLASHLRQQHDARQLASGKAAWEQPRIMPLTEWVRREWEASLQPRALLTEHQSLAVWERIVEADESVRGLLDRGRLARRALEAWTRCREWCLDPGDWGAVSPEAGVFARWAGRWRRECEQNLWVDASDALATLIEGFSAMGSAVPEFVRLAGFDSIPPLVERLVDTLRVRGGRVRVDVPPRAAEGAVRVAVTDVDAEVELCARWVRRHLAGGAEKIGIVATDPNAVRFALLRSLRDQLAPGQVGIWEGRGPVSVSLGIPLAHTPPVAAALALLAVGRGAMEADRWGRLLGSPFIAGAETERVPRGRLHERLLSRGPRALWPSRLLDWVGEQFPAPDGEPERLPLPRLREVLSAWCATLAAAPARARTSRWATLFQERLAALGWPGERPLDSESYQTVQSWEEALGRLAALDTVLPPVAAEEALRRLLAICREMPFQPQDEGAAPVALLGTLEAVGMSFSHLWVMGMADAAWPPPPDPNPFIPYRLQREARMPHASPEVQLDHARTVTDRLLAAAPAVVVSHPLLLETREAGPSPLIRHLPEVTPDVLDAAPDLRLARQIAEAGRTESVIDTNAPPVPARGSIRGGTGLFTDQAACPFRALARYRLGASRAEGPGLGLGVLERGDVAHRVLHRLWNDLKDSTTLEGLSPEELRDRVTAAVDPVAAEAVEQRALGGRFLDVERERLARLVLEWLEVERKRGPFRVAGAEQQASATIGGVSVDLRLDRIDILPDGREVLIDYKTGTTHAARKDWDGARPRAPQLPLYVLTRPEGSAAAVAFARLKRGDLKYEGQAARDGILPPAHRSRDAVLGDNGFQNRVAEWRVALEGLAEAYLRGDAAVDPLDGTQTCKYCDLTPLCRYNERGGNPTGDGGEGAGDE